MKKSTIKVLILAGTLMFLGSNYSWGQTDSGMGGASQSAAGSAENSQSWFNARDTNKDGQISHEEFMGYHESRFQSADANGDGFLTVEEIREYRKGEKDIGDKGKGKKTRKGGSSGAN